MNNTRIYNKKHKIITVGHSCNQKCIFCNMRREDRANNKKTLDIIKDIKKAKVENYESIEFTGGEPTIRRDIFKLIEYSAKNNFKEIMISTNGIMFSYMNFTKKILDMGLNYIILSIHGTRELHNHLTRTESYDKTIKGINNISDYSKMHNTMIKLQLNIVINKKNMHNIELFINDIKKIYLHCILLIFINPKDMSNEELKDLVPTLKDASDVAKKLINDYPDIKFDTQNIPFCFMKGYEENVNLNMLNKNTSMLEVDGEEDNIFSKADNLRTKVDVCDSCLYNDRCLGISKDYFRLYDDKDIYPVKDVDENAK